MTKKLPAILQETLQKISTVLQSAYGDTTNFEAFDFASASNEILKIADELQSPKQEPGKLLVYMVAALMRDTTQYESYSRIKLPMKELLDLIILGDFKLTIPEESKGLDRAINEIFPSMRIYDNLYDASLLYLALNNVLYEKYYEAGIFLGKVMGVILPSHVAEWDIQAGYSPGGATKYKSKTFLAQEKLLEILQQQNLNPFAEVTLLEVGGSHIKEQPMAKLLKRCDAIDIYDPRYAPRSDFLLLDTIAEHLKTGNIAGHLEGDNMVMDPYKFVIASRVIEQGSRIIYAKQGLFIEVEKTERSQMANCLAAMAELTRVGGFIIHRSLSNCYGQTDVLGNPSFTNA